ncbi:MAG: SLBB domain-containing protein [Armatimonadota bacterium]
MKVMAIMYYFTRLVFLICFIAIVMMSFAYADGSKLARGDIISVTVDGEKDFTKNYQIDSFGFITMPLIQKLNIVDMSTSDAAVVITKALNDILINPQVSVAFVERVKMQVFVVGQVKTPGATQIGDGDRVIQALSQAGYDDTADLSKISIRRGDKAIGVDLVKYLKAEDLDANIELQSGDTIVVPPSISAGTITVTGQVTKTGPLSLKSGMTFRDAMGLSGGATTEADTDKISIKRDNVAESLHVDYKLAMAGDKIADIELKPGDTIYVPEIETSYFTILGGVQKPGQYPIKGKMTLSAGIGLAGGSLPETGDLSKVSIARNESGKSGQTIVVNLKDLIANNKEEPVLQRGDVVYVKEKKRQPGFSEILSNVLSLGWLFRP